nr:hypothetical protein [Desulfobacula sp.]
MDKKRILQKLFWDRIIDPDYLLGLMEGMPERIPGEKTDLYRRLLTSCDWYTLLQIFSIQTLKDEILKEEVIVRVFPEELKNRYRYARKYYLNKLYPFQDEVLKFIQTGNTNFYLTGG